MDTKLLEDAIVLLEERNLSAAAARRHVTQPAFSRRIRALEQWIGRPLLVRGPNRIDIAPALEQSEVYIRGLLAHLNEVRNQIHGTAEAAPLVLVAPHSLSHSVVPELYRQASARSPGLAIRLRTQNQEVSLSWFLRGEADILIAYELRDLPRIPFDESIARHVWRRDGLIPVVGGSLRHNVNEERQLIDPYPVIQYPASSPIGALINEHELTVEARLRGAVAVETAFSVGIARMILQGIGAAWVPHSILHDEIMSGAAVILGPQYGRIALDIVLFARHDNQRASNFIATVSSLGMRKEEHLGSSFKPSP